MLSHPCLLFVKAVFYLQGPFYQGWWITTDPTYCSPLSTSVRAGTKPIFLTLFSRFGAREIFDAHSTQKVCSFSIHNSTTTSYSYHPCFHFIFCSVHRCKQLLSLVVIAVLTSTTASQHHSKDQSSKTFDDTIIVHLIITISDTSFTASPS